MGSEVRQAWRLADPRGRPPREPGRQGAPRSRRPLQYLQGVGPQRARQLERLGLVTVQDALNHFPRDYQDRREFVPFHKLPLGETGVVQGTVFGVAPPRRGSRAPVQVTFRDQTGYFTALWFGRGFLAQMFKRDQRVVLYGKKALAKDRRIVLDDPEFEIVEEDEPASIHMGRVVPVYPLTEGLFQKSMRQFLHGLVETHAENAPDILPEELRRRRDLLPVAEAYRAVHFPEQLDDVETARRRFAFEDFFVLQVGLAIKRRRQAREHGRSLAPPGRARRAAPARRCPFALTPAQERVWSEIRSDLARPVPMNRLLQGDVGSGKTIVAVMALLTAVEAGYQAVLMAPTEILAEQHFRTLRALVEPLGLTVAWLSAGQRGRERQAALEALRSGVAAIGVGTHALIQDDGGAPAPRASPSSTSSTASASSSARRFAGRASIRTCWS